MNSEWTILHVNGGSGGGALGFAAAEARLGHHSARFRCLGSLDVDASACRDFRRLTGGKATVIDLFDREQYQDYHGKPPPSSWREATPADIIDHTEGQHPDVIFFSPPCKGFSGLLSKKSASSSKYQALNRLVTRELFLLLEAFQGQPPKLILMENVPRIQSRGRELLDQISSMLRSYGYAIAETTHDCGELGGLAQHRRRFLMVARHREQIPPYLYEPPKRRLRSIGEVIGSLPVPGGDAGGPMHALPSLQWRTWVRLALVEAGGDWRSLRKLTVEDGIVQRLSIVPALSAPEQLIDPGYGSAGATYPAYGVRRWSETSGAVSAQAAPGTGQYSISDPRLGGVRHNNVYRVMRWSKTSCAVTTGGGPSSGGLCVQDPRPAAWRNGRAHFSSGGHYGVMSWEKTAGAVVGHAKHDRGRFSVADPRAAKISQVSAQPAQAERCRPVIISLDGTWHRPLTTLELAALQGFPVEQLTAQPLDGSNTTRRQHIGNAVPPPAALAIAETMLKTLLLNAAGKTFVLSSDPVWVNPSLSLQIALGVVQ